MPRSCSEYFSTVDLMDNRISTPGALYISPKTALPYATRGALVLLLKEPTSRTQRFLPIPLLQIDVVVREHNHNR